MFSRKKTKNTDDEIIYSIKVFDSVEGLPSNPIIFEAQKKKFDNNWYLVNMDEDTKDQFDKVLFPSVQKLKSEDKYKNLEDVQQQIKLIKEKLTSKKYLDDKTKNEIDYENDLAELSMIEQKKIFEQVDGQDIFVLFDKGIPHLQFIRETNVLLPIAFNTKTRMFHIPTNSQIQFHSTRKAEIDRDFPSQKKASVFNLKNIMIILFIFLCIFNFVWTIKLFGAQEDLQEPLMKCQEKRNNDLDKCGKYLSDIYKNNINLENRRKQAIEQEKKEKQKTTLPRVG